VPVWGLFELVLESKHMIEIVLHIGTISTGNDKIKPLKPQEKSNISSAQGDCPLYVANQIIGSYFSIV